MNGSELRIQLWTLHVAEACRTWPFLIRIPSQFKAFQVLINCFYGFGFWRFGSLLLDFGYARVAHDECDSENQTPGGWLWVLVLNWSPTETIEKKIPAESWVSWPNSTNPKIERRLTNVLCKVPLCISGLSLSPLSQSSQLSQPEIWSQPWISTFNQNINNFYFLKMWKNLT